MPGSAAVITDPAHGVLVVRTSAAGGWDLPRISFLPLPATASSSQRSDLVGKKFGTLTGYPFLSKGRLSFKGIGPGGADFYFHDVPLAEHLDDEDWKALWAQSAFDISGGDPSDPANFGFAVCVGDDEAQAPFVVVKVDGRSRKADQTLAPGALEAFRWCSARGAFPPLESIWYHTILFQNSEMPGIETEYGAFARDFLLRVRESKGASGAAVLQETPFYRAALEAVIEWKSQGQFNPANPNADEMKELSDKVEAVADEHKLDLGFKHEVTMFRVDTAANALAVGEFFLRDQLSLQLKRGCFGAESSAADFTIRPGIKLFPVFMFDKRGEYFNECEVLAIGNLLVTRAPDERGEKRFKVSNVVTPAAAAGGGFYDFVAGFFG